MLINLQVRHIDYGTVESVSVGALKPLRREWAALPAQAVRARLAGVRPPAAGRRWPHAASAHFLQLVRDTRLVANIVAVDREVGSVVTRARYYLFIAICIELQSMDVLKRGTITHSYFCDSYVVTI